MTLRTDSVRSGDRFQRVLELMKQETPAWQDAVMASGSKKGPVEPRPLLTD